MFAMKGELLKQEVPTEMLEISETLSNLFKNTYMFVFYIHCILVQEFLLLEIFYESVLNLMGRNCEE